VPHTQHCGHGVKQVLTAATASQLEVRPIFRRDTATHNSICEFSHAPNIYSQQTVTSKLSFKDQKNHDLAGLALTMWALQVAVGVGRLLWTKSSFLNLRSCNNVANIMG
jgi:hypothetical protein